MAILSKRWLASGLACAAFSSNVYAQSDDAGVPVLSPSEARSSNLHFQQSVEEAPVIRSSSYVPGMNRYNEQPTLAAPIMAPRTPSKPITFKAHQEVENNILGSECGCSGASGGGSCSCGDSCGCGSLACDACCTDANFCATECCDAGYQMDIGCSACDTGCVPWWAHRSGMFGEILYLAPGNSDLIYAYEVTDPAGPQGDSPTGPMGILNVSATTGFRFGFNRALSQCSSFYGAFTRWDGRTAGQIEATGANVLNPILFHPSNITNGSYGLQSSALQTHSFQFAEMGIRRVMSSGNHHVVNWTGGLRYGNMAQKLNIDMNANAVGNTNLKGNVDFDGLGLLAGIDGTRKSATSGWLMYGKADASMLGGTWRADTRQTNQFNAGVIASNYHDFRLTPVLHGEVGIGWQSKGGRFRATSGYTASSWLNAIAMRDYIQSYNSRNFVDMVNGITFSGLTGSIEIRR